MKHDQKVFEIIERRKAFVELLRNTPETKHCRYVFVDYNNLNGQMQFCTIGLYRHKHRVYDFRDSLALPDGACEEIVRWNDELQLTFTAIADRFEKTDWPIVAR